MTWPEQNRDESRYQAYCEFCQRVGIQPEEFIRWLYLSEHLSPNWGMRKI